MKKQFIVWFKDVEKEDYGLVGQKGTTSGEMTRAGFFVPPGFIITTDAYFSFLDENKLHEKIATILKNTNFESQSSLEFSSRFITKLIRKGKLSEQLVQEVFSAYKGLGGVLRDALVAIRCSTSSADLHDESFVGHQETYLNIRGEANVLVKMKDAWASLFSIDALFFRHKRKFHHPTLGMAVVIQKMVSAEKSGFLYTVDPTTNDKSKIIIHSIFGLGEFMNQSDVTPDLYTISKLHETILDKHITIQTKQLRKKGIENKYVKVSPSKGKLQKISDTEIHQLVTLGKAIEHHYYFPQIIEWAIEKEKVYILNTTPITTTIHEDSTPIQPITLLLQGLPASPGIASGPIHIIDPLQVEQHIADGEILVFSETVPDDLTHMKKAAAIITDVGLQSSHTAVISREIGIPAVVGARNATRLLNGTVVTVNGTKGEVYKGAIQNTQTKRPVEQTKTATKLFVNLSSTLHLETIASKNVDGVGMLQAEIILREIGIHPKQLIQEGKKKLLTEKLTQYIQSCCQIFSPRPVIYSALNLTSNEYNNLQGGQAFETIEQNPFLGLRGAYRTIYDPVLFQQELEVITTLLDIVKLKNIELLIPYVRTVEELIKIKQIINDVGLQRTGTFKLWLQIAIPANIIMLEKFIEVGIDGVIIDADDLAMLLLGADKKNNNIITEFNYMDQSALWAYEKIIQTCKLYGISSSFCIHSTYLHPELIKKLVRWGVTSISVSPELTETTREMIYQTEKMILQER